jgi:UDP-N-acetylmuramate dehydrogenase
VLQVKHEHNFFSNQKNIATDIVGKIMHKTQIRGVLKYDEPMVRHTSWRVGGNAECYFKPADIDDLCCFLSTLSEDDPIMWIGMGSNLLVRDGGIKGTVISTANVPNELEVVGVNLVRVSAGIPCAKVARFCAKSELLGAEFLAGIPGTIGGALAMNAGAFGGETWDIVSSVEILNRLGQREKRNKDEFEIAYRNVNLANDEWFITAELKLDLDSEKIASQRINQLLEQRALTQPLGQASCGSVFRNPPNDYAARLIEACGLKGKCVGDACVSEKHANFIINMGEATAKDIEQLITHIREVVKRDHGLNLIPEVKIVGAA